MATWEKLTSSMEHAKIAPGNTTLAPKEELRADPTATQQPKAERTARGQQERRSNGNKGTPAPCAVNGCGEG